MKTEKEIILEAILSDRRNGIKLYPREYLPVISPYGDRNKALNRIQRVFSDNREAINEASDSTRCIEDNTSIEEYFDYAKTGKLLNARLENFKYNKRVKFSDPTVIVFSSDVHLGSAGCDYDSCMEDFRFIKDNDVKIVSVGDTGEMKKEFPKNLFSILSQVLSPDMQSDLIAKLFKALKPQILGAIEGNHGANSRSGNEHAESIAAKAAGVDYFQGNCLLEIDVDGAKYRIFARHKPMSSSKLSPLIGARKMATMESADCFVCSHIHRPTFGVDWVLGKKRVCIITGTYNTSANYSRVGYGEYSARDEFPALLLFPKEKKMMVFASMRDAVKHRNLIMQ